MNFDFMTSIFLFHDKNTSINDKSIISEKVYFCNVNFTRHPRRQIHQNLPKNRLNLSLIYDAEHSVILTELQSALRLPPHLSPFPHIDAIADQWKIPQTILHGRARDTSRPRQMVDIQYNTTIMGGREVSRPYRVWFFAEGERYLSTEPL